MWRNVPENESSDFRRKEFPGEIFWRFVVFVPKFPKSELFVMNGFEPCDIRDFFCVF